MRRSIESTPQYTEKNESVEREYEILKTKHESALGGCRLESFLEKLELPMDYDETEKKAEELFSSVHGPAKYNLTRALHKANNLLESAIIEEKNTTEAICDKKEKLETAGINPGNIGDVIFFETTKNKPVAPVTFYRKGSYFVLKLSMADFEKFQLAMRISGNSPTYANGVLHAHLSISGHVLISNVVVINEGYVPGVLNKSFKHKFTEKHEVQHLINNVILGSYHAFDLVTAQEHRNRQNEDGIKNEFLAFLKGRTKPEHIGELLAGESLDEPVDEIVYSKLYRFSSDEDTRKMRGSVMKSVQAVSSFLSRFNVEAVRDVLVFHLIALPLSHFPARIKKLEQFYERRVNEFMHIARLPRQTAIQKAFFTNEEPQRKAGHSANGQKKRSQYNAQSSKVG